MRAAKKSLKIRDVIRGIYCLALFCATLYTVISTSGCSQSTAKEAVSYRWMDRVVYFADQNASDPNRNSFFERKAVQDALDEIGAGTMLGSGYFSYMQVPEAGLEAIFTATDGLQFKSFVLIWPDDLFNAWAVDKYNGSIPDLNAITVVNALNKRQFYMIIRASCTTAGSPNCNNVGSGGLKALVARQLGTLVGMEFDCANTAGVMCATPNNNQWTDSNKSSFFNSMNNRLENILNSPGFYL